jgi:hypothetical protein
MYIRWETVDSIVREWKSWNSTFLEIVKHIQHTSLYILHIFIFLAIFLKALLLMQTDQLCDCMHYLTKHIIMKVWVKIIDSVWHHKLISKMRFTCPLYTPGYITVHISQQIMMHIIKNVINDILCFTIHTIFLWPYILHANNKFPLVGQLPISLWRIGCHPTFF